MMRSVYAAAVAACLAIAAPAAAQTAGNNSGTAALGWYGVQASFRDDPSVEGGKALRVEVPGKGANPWDGGVGAKVERAVRAGDEIINLLGSPREGREWRGHIPAVGIGGTD